MLQQQMVTSIKLNKTLLLGWKWRLFCNKLLNICSAFGFCYNPKPIGGFITSQAVISNIHKYHQILNVFLISSSAITLLIGCFFKIISYILISQFYIILGRIKQDDIREKGWVIYWLYYWSMKIFCLWHLKLWSMRNFFCFYNCVIWFPNFKVISAHLLLQLVFIYTLNSDQVQEERIEIKANFKNKFLLFLPYRPDLSCSGLSETVL